MTSGRSPSINREPIYISPEKFADHLFHQQEYCLFLDIDGTLADFTLNPKNSFIPNATLILLQKIQNHGVKIAAVTGRSLAEAKQMLFPLTLPIAATHGLEIAFDDDSISNDENIVSIDTIELATIRQAIIQSCRPYNNLIIEKKPYSVALHFRKNHALADVAYTIMTETLKTHNNWSLKSGKYVWEVVPKGVSKGTAILTLLEKIQSPKPLFPIFIGDDITDEAGFVAVQGDSKLLEDDSQLIKGMGIKVGCEPTHANYYVHDTHEVTVLLDSLLSLCQQHNELVKETVRVRGRHVV
ncbi:MULTISPECIES: trehalose-phosphatase [Psychrobacter]|uniref:trehalose-phosphatase n=1 Tax=Psychrobacter TaxID=497 RepID=UPI0019184787|nr:trehalose-phosphatase [Psychrobacter okhotskensis]